LKALAVDGKNPRTNYSLKIVEMKLNNANDGWFKKNNNMMTAITTSLIPHTIVSK